MLVCGGFFFLFLIWFQSSAVGFVSRTLYSLDYHLELYSTVEPMLSQRVFIFNC